MKINNYNYLIVADSTWKQNSILILKLKLNSAYNARENMILFIYKKYAVPIIEMSIQQTCSTTRFASEECEGRTLSLYFFF